MEGTKVLEDTSDDSMENSLSSGYSSEASTSNIYDNNVSGMKDIIPELKKETSNGSVPESGIEVENIYHRIHTYDDEGDIAIKKGHSNQSRPLPPTPRDADYDNSSHEEKHRRPWLRIFLASIVLVLIVVGGIALYLRLSCHKGWLCSEDGDNPRVPHPCDVQTSSNYSNQWNSTCNLTLYNATALLLQSEGEDGAMYNLENGKFIVTIKGMVITLSRQSEGLSVDIEIQEVNCSTVGIYFVTLTNGTHNESYTVNVKINPTTQQCPCNLEFDAGKPAYIECITSPRINVSVIFHDTMSGLKLAENISIGDILTSGSLPAEGLPDIMLIATNDSSGASFRLEFSTVKCHHNGTYEIVLGNTSYKTVFNVKSYPKIPIFGTFHDELGGLVEGDYGEVRCEAFVGCGVAPTLYHKVLDRFEPVEKDKIRSTNKSEDIGMTFYEARVFKSIYRGVVNNTEYMCNFMFNGQAYQSEIYLAQVIPEDYCSTARIKVNCNGKHPYDCGKFITCTTRAWERPCDRGLHFYFNEVDDTCNGDCDYPEKANCQI